MDYTLKVMSIEEDHPSVRRFLVVRPSGFVFDPGKSAMVAVNKLGLEDTKKRCPFFSLNSDFYIELLFNEDPADESNKPFFDLKAGEEIIMSDIVGNLEYKGPGGFIAAGKGVFQVLDMFKQLKKMDSLKGNMLLFMARSQEEVYFERMFKHTFPNNCAVIIGKDSINPREVKKIDEAILRQKLPDLQHEIYVTGPKSFVESAVMTLEQLGLKYQKDIVD